METQAPGAKAPNSVANTKKHSRSYIRSLRRSVSPTIKTGGNSLPSQYRLLVAGWTPWTYPGTRRLTLSTIGNLASWDTWKDWECGDRRLPRWVASVMLAHLQAWRGQIEALESNLKAWIANPASEDRRKLNGANLRGRRLPRETGPREPKPGG